MTITILYYIISFLLGKGHSSKKTKREQQWVWRSKTCHLFKLVNFTLTIKSKMVTAKWSKVRISLTPYVVALICTVFQPVQTIVYFLSFHPRWIITASVFKSTSTLLFSVFLFIKTTSPQVYFSLSDILLQLRICFCIIHGLIYWFSTGQWVFGYWL